MSIKTYITNKLLNWNLKRNMKQFLYNLNDAESLTNKMQLFLFKKNKASNIHKSETEQVTIEGIITIIQLSQHFKFY